MRGTLHLMKQDFLRFYYRGGPTRARRVIHCLQSPGVRAALTYRFGHWLLGQNFLVRLCLEVPYRLFIHCIRTRWGIDLARRAQIGEGLFIPHYGGIIVSSSAKIGRNVEISHGVTIGHSGQGDKRGVPVIGDNVFIGPGAMLIGKIHIGNNVKIGANAVIHKDVPDNAVAVLDPGFKIISYQNTVPVPGQHQTQNNECDGSLGLGIEAREYSPVTEVLAERQSTVRHERQ